MLEMLAVLTSRRATGFLVPMRITLIVSSLVLLLGCGSGAVPHVASPADAQPSVSAVSKSAPAALPEAECDADTGDCLPPADWAVKLCRGVHPEVALHMFRGGSPWKRLYSRASAPAYNGAGGPSLPEERVGRGEELIALRRNSEGRQSAAGEMSVGETAGYDVLRWNGSCVTLHDGEFSTKPPRRRQHARVEWRWLGDAVRSALRNDHSVSRAFVARRKECQGVTFGRVSKKCVEQDNSLVDAIVNYVRSGGELPAPSESL